MNDLTLEDVERATNAVMKRNSSRPPPMNTSPSVVPPPRSFRQCPECDGKGFVTNPAAPGWMGRECPSCLGVGW